MRPHKTFFIIAIQLLFLLNFFSIACAFTGKLVKVIDGDTVDVLHNNLPERIRLNGIDSPENGQAYGQKAKEFVIDLAAKKVVIVEVIDTDRYGRTVGEVILPDGRNLNKEIVKNGHAWWYRKYSTDASLAQLEKEARSAQKGLWRDPNPTPPWEWRAARRNSGAAPNAVNASRAAPFSTTDSSTLFHGNVRSSVFHQPSCKDYNYNCKNCTISLATREQALLSGYRPCGMCNP